MLPYYTKEDQPGMEGATHPDCVAGDTLPGLDSDQPIS